MCIVAPARIARGVATPETRAAKPRDRKRRSRKSSLSRRPVTSGWPKEWYHRGDHPPKTDMLSDPLNENAAATTIGRNAVTTRNANATAVRMGETSERDRSSGRAAGTGAGIRRAANRMSQRPATNTTYAARTRMSRMTTPAAPRGAPPKSDIMVATNVQRESYGAEVRLDLVPVEHSGK